MGRGKRRGDAQVERPEADQGMIRRWSLLGRALNVLSLLLSGASGFVPPSSVLRASPSYHALAVMSFDGAERASALAFCRESPTAVIATVWPTAHSQVSAARAWLDTTGCTLVHEASVYLSPQAAVPAILALYHGEEWLDSNCWYMESPLPEGPPQGPFAGAKWKAQLAFREDAPMHVFVLDAAWASRLWSSKYAIREKLRASVGSLGNSCLHLTDDQSDALNAWRQGHGVLHGGGYECDSSYAFHCARVLLNPQSVSFLNKQTDVNSPAFSSRFQAYSSWLAEANFEDTTATGFTDAFLPT